MDKKSTIEKLYSALESDRKLVSKKDKC